jgi:hypothetical protein
MLIVRTLGNVECSFSMLKQVVHIEPHGFKWLRKQLVLSVYKRYNSAF